MKLTLYSFFISALFLPIGKIGMGFFIFSEANPAIRFNFLSRSKKRDKKISTAIRARASVYYLTFIFYNQFLFFQLEFLSFPST